MMPGKESRLGRAQERADSVEAAGTVDERHGARDETPRHHDPCDPLAGAHSLEHQIGRHFEEEVGKEEDAGAEAERRGGQADVLVHLQGREAQVGPVEIGDEVGNDKERHEPLADPSHGALFDA